MLSTFNISEGEVFSALTRLDPNKGSGPDKIPCEVAKNLSVELTRPITMLINLSIGSGSFPSAFKQGNVIPLHKSGDRHNVQNYRPITLLNVFSKVFESVILTRLKMQYSNYISTHQHGFMNKKSTVTNLVSMSLIVSDALNKGEQVDVCHFDFSKAFDKVNHK